MFIDRIRLAGKIDAGSYLKNIPAVKHLEKEGSLRFDSDVTIFTGENGTGKSTIIEAIAVACGFNPEGGTKNYIFSTKDTHSELYKQIAVSRVQREKDGYFLRAESFYNASSYLEDLDKSSPLPSVLSYYGGISLHQKSHGEGFMALMENRFGGNGLYILDEPESALSPSSILRFLYLVNMLVKKNSQFIIATHSPIILTYPNAQIYELTDNGISQTDCKSTGHYMLTKSILDSPERIYRYLFDDNIKK